MSGTCVVKVAILMALPGLGHGATTVWEITGPDYVRRCVKLSAAETSVAAVERLSLEWAGEARGRRLMHVLFYSEDAYRPYCFHPWCLIHVHNPVEFWFWHYERQRKETAPFLGFFFGRGGSAVVAIRDEEGTVTRKVFGGEDPLLLDAAGTVCEIVHISYRATPDVTDRLRNERATLRAGEERVELFVTVTGEVSIDLGREVYRQTTAWLPFHNVTLWLRTDRWFAALRFPLVFPTGPQGPAPDLDDWDHRPFVDCLDLSGELKCW